jgi:hypothetical protein
MTVSRVALGFSGPHTYSSVKGRADGGNFEILIIQLSIGRDAICQYMYSSFTSALGEAYYGCYPTS